MLGVGAKEHGGGPGVWYPRKALANASDTE
jgi:hypothetical protein